MLTVTKYLFIVFLVGSSISIFGQIHLQPENGGNGLPGIVAKSFEIKWAKVDSVSIYEYVMSDNPLCFTDCPGDTRQNKTLSTSVFEFNLQKDVWYYWSTRVYYQNGDTTHWSGISSFLAKTPLLDNKDQIITIAPNPVQESINLNIDWAINPYATKMTMDLFSYFGQKIGTQITIEKEGNSRYQSFQYEAFLLSNGIYFADFIVDDNPNNPNNRILKKIIVAK